MIHGMLFPHNTYKNPIWLKPFHLGILAISYMRHDNGQFLEAFNFQFKKQYITAFVFQSYHEPVGIKRNIAQGQECL